MLLNILLLTCTEISSFFKFFLERINTCIDCVSCHFRSWTITY